MSQSRLAVANKQLSKTPLLTGGLTARAFDVKPSIPLLSKPANKVRQLLPTIRICPRFFPDRHRNQSANLLPETASIPALKHVPGNSALVEFGSGGFFPRIAEAQIWRGELGY